MIRTFLVTFILSLLGGFVGFILSMGTTELIFYLLTFLVVGLVAALTANGIENRRMKDDSRGRLGISIAITEAAAFVLALIIARTVHTPFLSFIGNNLNILLMGTTFLTIIAMTTSVKFRTSKT